MKYHKNGNYYTFSTNNVSATYDDNVVPIYYNRQTLNLYKSIDDERVVLCLESAAQNEIATKVFSNKNDYDAFIDRNTDDQDFVYNHCQVVHDIVATF